MRNHYKTFRDNHYLFFFRGFVVTKDDKRLWVVYLSLVLSLLGAFFIEWEAFVVSSGLGVLLLHHLSVIIWDPCRRILKEETINYIVDPLNPPCTTFDNDIILYPIEPYRLERLLIRVINNLCVDGDMIKERLLRIKRAGLTNPLDWGTFLHLPIYCVDNNDIEGISWLYRNGFISVDSPGYNEVSEIFEDPLSFIDSSFGLEALLAKMILKTNLVYGEDDGGI